MRSIYRHTLIPGCSLAAILLSSCGGGGCGGAGAASGICPPPVHGYAQVNGRALKSDGSPAAGEQAFVSCGDAIGGNSAGTNAEGRFGMPLVFAVEDTVLFPIPPRDEDGKFTVSCRAFLQLPNDVLLVHDPLPVQFAPTPGGVVPTVAELREEAL